MVRRSGGFTLMEVLVTLAITGLLVAVLVNALYYAFRVESALRDEVVIRENALRVRAWFSETLAGCLPTDNTSASAFSGSELEIRCETTRAIKPGRLPAPARIRFALERDGFSGKTTLLYAEGETGTATPLDAWDDREAAFRYVDDKGREVDRWPTDRAEPEALPRLVKLVLGKPDTGEVWVVALDADPWLPPKVVSPFHGDFMR